MILHADLILPRPWNPMERNDLGSRVWGENERGSSGRSRAGHGEGEGKGGEKRESDLNTMGPKTTGSV